MNQCPVYLSSMAAAMAVLRLDAIYEARLEEGHPGVEQSSLEGTHDAIRFLDSRAELQEEKRLTVRTWESSQRLQMLFHKNQAFCMSLGKAVFRVKMPEQAMTRESRTIPPTHWGHRRLNPAPRQPRKP